MTCERSEARSIIYDIPEKTVLYQNSTVADLCTRQSNYEKVFIQEPLLPKMDDR